MGIFQSVAMEEPAHPFVRLSTQLFSSGLAGPSPLRTYCTSHKLTLETHAGVLTMKASSPTRSDNSGWIEQIAQKQEAMRLCVCAFLVPPMVN